MKQKTQRPNIQVSLVKIFAALTTLATVGLGDIGITQKVSLLIDDMGAVSTTNWLLSLGLFGMVGPTKPEG
jgi:hypothetical protein